MTRARGLAMCLAASAALTAAAAGMAAAPLRTVDLDGVAFDLERASAGAAASVFIFTTMDCPIANRYAPDIQRIASTFASHNVRAWLVFANPADQPDAIRSHLKQFALTLPALRDPVHDLVRLTGATIAPEAAIVDRRGRVVYHGRIDDRWVDFGRERLVPTRRDLEDALTALLDGRPIAEPVTQAVGCYLADFRPPGLP